MSETINSNFPLLLVVLPAIFGLLILAAPQKWKASGAIAAAGSAVALVQVLCLRGQSLEFTRAWAGWGMDFSLKLTAQNYALVVAAAVLTFLVAGYSLVAKAVSADEKTFHASTLFALAMASGALMSNNLVAMLFFWQAMWAPVFGMIKAGGKNAWKTSVRAVFTAGFSDLLMILGIGFASLAAESMTIDQMHVPMTTLGTAGFLLMSVGALGKLGAIPFHGWLYKASEDAPSPFMGLIPGGLNLLMGTNLFSKFPGMFDTTATSGAMLLVMIAAAGSVVLSGMLAMSAGSFKKLAVALNVAQAGALVLGATSVAGGVFVDAAVIAAAAGSSLYLAAGAMEKGKAGKSSSAASFLYYVAAGAAVAVVFTGALFRIALHESWLSLILAVVSLIGAIFAVSGVTRLIRAARDDSAKAAEPAFDLGGAQAWLDRTLCDPYPAFGAFIRGYAGISLKVNDAISWFYDVGVVWFVGFLSSLVKRAHNGSQSRYVLWVLLGAVVVIAIFALS